MEFAHQSPSTLALDVPRHGQRCHTQQRRLPGLWEGAEKLNSHSQKEKQALSGKKHLRRVQW